MKIAYMLGGLAVLAGTGLAVMCHNSSESCLLGSLLGSAKAGAQVVQVAGTTEATQPTEGECATSGGCCSGSAATAELAKASAAATYNVDAVHSSVHFMIKHGGLGNFYGRFNTLEGSISFDPENLDSSSMTFTVDIASVDTNNEGRDEHLRSPDFFNARQFPEATFTSTSFTAAGEDMYTVEGNLTVHGATKPVTVNFNWLGSGTIRGTDTAAFEANMEFKRSDFGMTTYIADDGGDTGGLGNTVTVLLSVEAARE